MMPGMAPAIRGCGGYFTAAALLMAALALTLETIGRPCAAQVVRCDGRRQGLREEDCARAVAMLTEDAFKLYPNHFVQESFGSCVARVQNFGGVVLHIYRGELSLPFSDMLRECLHYNSHPAFFLTANNLAFYLTPSRYASLAPPSPSSPKSTSSSSLPP